MNPSITPIEGFLFARVQIVIPAFKTRELHLKRVAAVSTMAPRKDD